MKTILSIIIAVILFSAGYLFYTHLKVEKNKPIVEEEVTFDPDCPHCVKDIHELEYLKPLMINPKPYFLLNENPGCYCNLFCNIDFVNRETGKFDSKDFYTTIDIDSIRTFLNLK